MRLQSQVLVRWAGLLKEGVDLVGAGTPAGARLTEHTAFFEFLNTELPGILDRWAAISDSRLPLALPRAPAQRAARRPRERTPGWIALCHEISGPGTDLLFHE